MSTPTPDEQLDELSGEISQLMKTLADARGLSSGYRGTENDYRLLAEEQEAKLPALRAQVRAKLAELNRTQPPT